MVRCVRECVWVGRGPYLYLQQSLLSLPEGLHILLADLRQEGLRPFLLHASSHAEQRPLLAQLGKRRLWTLEYTGRHTRTHKHVNTHTDK